MNPIIRPQVTRLITKDSAAPMIPTPSPEIRNYSQNTVDTFRTRDYTKPLGLPSRMKFTMANTSTSTAALYKIFDAVGAVTSLIGSDAAGSAATPTKLTMTIINDYIKGHDIVIQGMKLEATVSATQHNNDAYVYRGDLDGTYRREPLYPADAVNGSRYDNKVVSIDTNVYISSLDMLQFNVNASETLTATLFIGGVMNRA
jgi:hypothetical protein